MARRSAKSRKSAPESDPARAAFDEALKQLHDRALFNPMLMKAHISRQEGNLCPEGGWAVVTNNGAIHVHHSRRAEPEEWLFVIAHCLLHLALDHFKVKEDPFRWNAACDASIYSLFHPSRSAGRPAAQAWTSKQGQDRKTSCTVDSSLKVSPKNACSLARRESQRPT